ncbi:MAG: hypothetical protein H6825_15365, partial [Planctomycetes bacterium]|nr:hypothetical protein [Planctomycetota bacterium]
MAPPLAPLHWGLTRARTWHLALAERFVPPHVSSDDHESRRRVSTLVGACVVFSLIAPPYAALRVAIGCDEEAVAILLGALVSWCAPTVARRTGRLGLAGNMAVADLFAVLLFISSETGGLHAIGLAWMGVVPLLAMMVGTRRSAWTWTALCCLGAACFHELDLRGVDLTNGLDQDTLRHIRFMGTLLLFIALPSLASVFETAKQTALDQARASNERLAATRDDLA